jgi:hypothetical protein
VDARLATSKNTPIRGTFVLKSSRHPPKQRDLYASKKGDKENELFSLFDEVEIMSLQQDMGRRTLFLYRLSSSAFLSYATLLENIGSFSCHIN